jgi:UDP:flavonoid glycosyltransferase YjiC (YdhE family)
VDVYVTNGGFGGLQYALSNGIPVVAAGKTEDKPEMGNRVAFNGSGLNLKTNRPAPEKVAEAVRTVLANPDYRKRAEAIQADLARHDAPEEAADLLDRLAETGRPVLG